MEAWKGALDIAKELTERKFKSVLISAGGEMAERYKYKGVNHYEIDIERKGILNFFHQEKSLKGFDRLTQI